MSGQIVPVTVVTAPGCHLCDDALDGLAELGTAYALEVSVIDARSPEGGELLRTHRAAMNPLVLVNGDFLSSGRLPRGKLRALLAARTASTVTGARHG